ncbi:MAG: hypothetical protein LBU22_12425 [Dysgonamonadaceae bacterium]|jgi:hypothetical protein|nr:hypothetical protein [Dysgonamonadaceae bacterium]
MACYHIAGHILKGESPETIPGFSPFRYEGAVVSGKSVLCFRQGIALPDWEIAPQYRFQFEQFVCDFARQGVVYLFRMKPPEGSSLLLTIHSDGGVFQADTNIDSRFPVYALRFALWLAFGVAALHRKTVAVHASTVMYGGKSVLFLGESGTGKSTHTGLWLKHIPGTELLNDDSPFINVSEGIRVYGSPWSGKTPCYKPVQTPIAAIVRLRQAASNTIRRLNGLESIGALLPSCPPEFACDPELSGYLYDILSVVLQQTPVYSLACLPDAAAAELVFDTLKKDGCL